MVNILMIKRLKETISEQISTQRHAGGQAYVIARRDGTVLSAKTGTFGFDLFDAIEVPEDSNPKMFGGNACVPKSEAQVGVLRGLDQQSAEYDKAIQSIFNQSTPL